MNEQERRDWIKQHTTLTGKELAGIVHALRLDTEETDYEAGYENALDDVIGSISDALDAKEAWSK